MSYATDLTVTSSRAELPTLSDRLLGLVIMALVPAVFWAAMTGLTAAAIGSPMTSTALVNLGAGIAGFLVLVCAAITARASR